MVKSVREQTVVVILEERYCRTPDGSVWTVGPHAYQFWQRYLAEFDHVRVVARVVDVQELSGRARRADGPSVEIAAVPYYVGPLQFLRHAWAIRSAVRRAVGPEDAVIMRVPSTLAACLGATLRSSKRPFGLEVIGDPYDVFAPGAVTTPLRHFFRWWFPHVLRGQCLGAVGVAYVTEQALQNRYPCRAYSVGMSDVDLQDDAIVGEAPKFTTHYSSVELCDDDTVLGSRSIHELQSTRTEIVTVGSLEQPYKGIDILVKAVAQCLAAGIPLRLTVVGEGRYRASIEQLIGDCGISDSVTLTGQLNSPVAVRGILDQSHLFVLASRTEGLPRAMIEAMARALPCIGTRVGGIPELLDAADLVAPNDIEGLATKIREMVSNPVRMAEASSRNLRKANGYRSDLLTARRQQFFRHIRTITERWNNLQTTDTAGYLTHADGA
jgi:glycosyltransferase involved in cell wall biosynthesis